MKIKHQLSKRVKAMPTVMVGLVVTGRSTLLAVLVGWRLPIGASSLRRVSRRSLLLLGLLLVALLLAVAGLLGLVARLLLAICCRLRVAVLVVTGRLAVSIVTDGDKVKIKEKVSMFLWNSLVIWFLAVGYIPLWCSGSSLLAITRVGRLGSIPWLRAIRLGGSWSSSSRSAVITAGSICLG